MYSTNTVCCSYTLDLLKNQLQNSFNQNKSIYFYYAKIERKGMRANARETPLYFKFRYYCIWMGNHRDSWFCWRCSMPLLKSKENFFSSKRRQFRTKKECIKSKWIILSKSHFHPALVWQKNVTMLCSSIISVGKKNIINYNSRLLCGICICIISM